MPGPAIEAAILAAIPDATVTLTDLAGDDDHWAAHVVSSAFAGLPRVRQHRLVYEALGGRMGGALHALQLTTAAPAAEGHR
jgi:stress-induced morphogen